MSSRPTGTITFLFTDIEGSTRLWHAHPEPMKQALALHDRILHAAIEAHEGFIFKTIGDAVCAAFDRVTDAVRAMLASQNELHRAQWPKDTPIRVRMGLHSGSAEEHNGDYLGPTVNYAARLMSAAHGGQLLVSQAAQALIGESLTQDATLRDMGQIRLKDLPRPVRVFQLVHPGLPREFPPLRGLESTPNNLPHPVSSFVGRAKEIAEIRLLLDRQRLVTLVGPGGAGKSRLAVQIAGSVLPDYVDGVWLVDIGSLPDSSLLPQSLASVLGVAEIPSCTLERALIEHMRDKTVLLLLDNAERFDTAGARLIADLLTSSPRLKVLATARDRLALAGEQVYMLAPLELPTLDPLPPVEKLTQCDSVRLFVERARLAAAGFELTGQNADIVAQLCHKLDGMPLPIELAAAQTYSMPVESIAERLDDRFRLLSHSSVDLPHDKALGALIDWSYDRLSGQQKAVLRRTGVFSGGFTLEAAQAVCADDSLLADSIAAAVASLAQKQLITTSGNQTVVRYFLLGPVRDYALRRLDQAGEADTVRAMHQDYFLHLAEQAVPQLSGANCDEWLALLDTEEDNLRSALFWNPADTRGMATRLRLAGSLWVFWRMRGQVSEGQRWLAQALAVTEHSDSALGGILEWARGRLRVPADSLITRELMEDCQAKLREIGNQPAITGLWNTFAQTVRTSPAAQAVVERLDTSADQIRKLGRRKVSDPPSDTPAPPSSESPDPASEAAGGNTPC